MSEYIKAYRLDHFEAGLFVHRLHPVGLVWRFCLAHAAAAARMSWLLKKSQQATKHCHYRAYAPRAGNSLILSSLFLQPIYLTHTWDPGVLRAP